MERRARTQLALGLFLILVAAFLAALRFYPPLRALVPPLDWPMWVIIAGGIILLIGLLVGAPGMAVPACIVAGIGGILYYQNITDDWESWAYAWTLIPGFVGAGNILAGILGQNFRTSVRQGLNLIVISVVLFVVFAAIFGRLVILRPYREYLLAGLCFLLGLWFIVRSLTRSRKE
ncbi:MAG: hypothetical protein RML46_02400 [Anaerolineae bacterium]|nr:hypothetical protein [Anaerolineae bacterium]MDW8067747.1 hypothetical protein [Anaerolineae bacterium]